MNHSLLPGLGNPMRGLGFADEKRFQVQNLWKSYIQCNTFETQSGSDKQNENAFVSVSVWNYYKGQLKSIITTILCTSILPFIQ